MSTSTSSEWHELFLEELRQFHADTKASQPRLSLREFAAKLDLPVGTVSKLQNRKLKLSKARALSLLPVVATSERRRRRILTAMGETTEFHRENLSARAAEVILNSWKHCAVLGLHGLDAEFKSPEALAKRLDVPREEVVGIRAELTEFGLLHEQDGEFIRREVSWASSDNVRSESVRRYHAQNLELAKDALRAIPTEERDFCSIQVCGSHRSLPQLRQEIRGFLNRVSALLDSEDRREELYTVNVQLFPLRR